MTHLFAAALVLGAATLGHAADAGIVVKKLVVTDKVATKGKAQVVYLAKGDLGIDKGTGTDVDAIDAVLEVFYTDDPTAGVGRFTMPQNDPASSVSGAWVQTGEVVKYENKDAPENGPVKLALIKPAKVAKVVAKALGDTDGEIDLIAGGTPSASGGITTILTVYDRSDGSLTRMCTRFATDDGAKVKVKEIAKGSGRKLIAKRGQPIPCTLDFTDDRFWLCKPGKIDDECLGNSLESTVFLPDGSSAIEAFVGSQDHPYDCFYIYPTVHLGGTGQAPADPDDVSLELDALLNQAARFTGQCRMFAPLYRQVRLATSVDRARFGEVAYRDVRAAWDEYLANHNGGRNVVIMGHSQGSGMVNRLLREEFDPDPALRARLITGLLIGGGVFVPRGEVVGGSFENIPLCTSAADTGCVIAFRTYGENFPPTESSNSLSSTDNDRACTNPAALGGGEGTLAAMYVSASSSQPVFQGSFLPTGATTPFVKLPALYTAECVLDADGFTYLQIRFRPGMGDVRQDYVNYPHPALAPSFLGTHIFDMQFTMGDLLPLVATKAAAMP